MKYRPNSSFLSNCDRNGKKQVEDIQARIERKGSKMFNQMFSYSKLYNSAGSNACRPQLVHSILMSILLEHSSNLSVSKMRRGFRKKLPWDLSKDR